MSREARARLEALQVTLAQLREANSAPVDLASEERVRVDAHLERMAPLREAIEHATAKRTELAESLRATIAALEELDLDYDETAGRLMTVKASAPRRLVAHAALTFVAETLRIASPFILMGGILACWPVAESLPPTPRWLLCFGAPIAAFLAGLRFRAPRTLFRDRLVQDPPDRT